jgi:hypothetical protein
LRKSSTERKALGEAKRAAKLPAGAPSEHDQPPVRALPGKRVRVLRGQLDLYGHEHGEDAA